MTVYVESNFVLEQALQQEQSESCDAIVSWAASGEISLVIPAFSLAEPHQALAQKEKVRNRLNNELQQQLSELGPFDAIPRSPRRFQCVGDCADKKRRSRTGWLAACDRRAASDG
jgi:hypothetical protein